MGYANRILKMVLTGAVVTALAVSSMADPAMAAQKKKAKKAEPNNRYASIVMDAETGAILSQSEPDKKLYPASLTKIMTLLLTFEAIENGQMSLRDRVPMTQRAVNMLPSKIGLPVGASMRVEDAIYALVTKSANDVAVALGEKIGGSEDRFAVMMTRKARDIGMHNTRFVNASGWHDPAQVSTARDMAILARYVIYRYPQYYHYFSTKNFTFQGKNYHNHNRLMNDYPGMDGMKTGYVGASGFNLVASAKRGNKRLIGVVFGGRSTASRNAHMATLLDRGFTGQGIDVAKGKAATTTSKVATVRQPAYMPPRKPAPEGVAVAQNNASQTISPIASVNKPVSGVAAAAAVIATPTTTGTPIVIGSLPADMLSEASEQGDFDPADITAERPWAIQIGAFASRVQTDKAIRAAQKVLPSSLATAQPVIVPLKTADGWVFRGRLSGYTKEQAQSACARLRECLPISPDAAAR